MQDKIVPRLRKLTFYKPDSLLPAKVPTPSYDGAEWYIEGSFSIVDKVVDEYNRTKPFYERRKRNPNGDLGHIFLILVCSAGFAQKHQDELARDNCRPLIFDSFDKDLVEKFIAEKIESAGDHITFDQLWEHLATFSDTEYDN